MKEASAGTAHGDVERARQLVRAATRLVAFTGAGVSTASGIPDFRSPGGVWSRHRPVTIQEFVASDEARRRYWQYKKESLTAQAQARPNAAHLALAGLEAEGRLLGVITQNIDGLHQEAGNRVVLELHGSNRRVECLDCRRARPADEVLAWLEKGCEVPTCDACGGFLKPATVSFGQSLPEATLREAFGLATSCDVLLVLGSSLAVHPAASVPEAAAAAGAALVIVNREPTPLDRRAAVVLTGEVEELLPRMASA